jgi:hypothetical protein|tara:strand:+ start:293 stop:532 length:240 start_codon:yes stop_codon:yes gene_type:complete
MRFIGVTHHEKDANQLWEKAKLREVMLNPSHIISIQRIWKRVHKSGEWQYISTDFWRVICRDNIHYVVLEKDVQRLQSS